MLLQGRSGTLIIRDIANSLIDMPTCQQRALQEHEIRKLGGHVARRTMGE